MDRRRFVAFVGSALAALPAALAQQPPARVWRVGFIGIGHASGFVKEVDWIRAGLRKLGYAEGRNLVIEYRWAEGEPERLNAIAREFVALKVDAMLSHSLIGVIAAAKATSTIPIVMADGGDPVAAGLARSLAKPASNVTGSFSFIPEETGKRLQLLKEVLPRIRRVAFLASSVDAAIAPKRKAAETAAVSMNVELREFSFREAADLPEVFNAMTAARSEAILLNTEPFLNSLASVIASLATVKYLPAIGYASFADVGGLLAYGANRPALYERVGYFLDQTFKGAKPGDLPFERAARFDLIVNLKTAKSLGVAIPQSVRLRADRVIE